MKMLAECKLSWKNNAGNNENNEFVCDQLSSHVDSQYMSDPGQCGGY